MFGLGLALIIDAAVTPNGRSSLIITGLVLLGLIPLDTWLTRMPAPASSKPAPYDQDAK